MATNDFIPYATNVGANVQSQAAYAADATQGPGMSSGIVPSGRFNKLLRQAIFGAATLFGFIFDTLGTVDVLDDGDIAGKKTLFARAIAQAVAAGGRCRLVRTNGATLTLMPYQGNKIFIPGTGLMTIPAAGVPVAAATALIEGGAPANNVTYYIYAWNNAGVLQLNLSATSHATDANGVEIRNGDSGRALVGMCRLVAGAFVESTAQRFTASFFNRQNKRITGGASGSTASASMVEIQVAGRAEFLTWGDEDIHATAHGSVSNSAANGTAQVILTADGSTAGSGSTSTSPAASFNEPVSSIFGNSGLTEGYHYLSIFANAGGGTATFAIQVGGIVRS
jgi:hypothetical protein